MDAVDLDAIRDAKLIDSKTRLVAMGLASNATGRIHTDAVRMIPEVGGMHASKWIFFSELCEC